MLLTSPFVATGAARWAAVLAALVLLAVAALWSGTHARDADVLATFLVVSPAGRRHAGLLCLPGACFVRQLTSTGDILHVSARLRVGCSCLYRNISVCASRRRSRQGPTRAGLLLVSAVTETALKAEHCVTVDGPMGPDHETLVRCSLWKAGPPGAAH